MRVALGAQPLHVLITVVFALSTSLCCALACIVPTRRALRIQPTDALRDEG